MLHLQDRLIVTNSPNAYLSDADLNIAQTAWGDSGVYVCNVVSGQDLTGNNEDYTELIVLGKVRAWSHIHCLFFFFSISFLLFYSPTYAGHSVHKRGF